ncbi:MAG TPA: DNA-binding protein [Elusimicrobia bacterium]|nr:DNA-binding protein [Elusimicrobiota bacterium]
MNIVKFEEIENKIIEIRSQKTILDSDVAKLYGVGTRDINKSVKNNPDKFPTGYIFELTSDEKQDVVENFHHLYKLKFSPQLPKAFTEKGLYMLATILKSPRATQTTISIIEAFAKLRQLTRNIKELSAIQDKTTQKSLMKKSGGLIAEILDDGLKTSGSETTVEINFAVLKLKHTIKKDKK